VSVVTARGAGEIAALEPLWRRTSWTGEQAEYEHFTAGAGDDPVAVFALRDDEPAGAAVGRIRRRRLDTSIGYVRVYAPAVRALELVSGGVVARDDAAASDVAAALAALLRDGAADALVVPALPVESASFRALAGLGGRQRFVPVWTRRRLVLPESFDAFLASRTRKIRAGIRYDSKKLLDALGEELSVTVHREADDLDALAADLEAVAGKTYQRALGAGFADTPEQRALARVDLEHGWLRAYVLSHRDRPIAFWLCSVHGGTITTRTTGYDPEYAQYRVGIYLLMRVIEDACVDPALSVLDFGPGRSPYKRHFGNDGYAEQNLVVFAPRLRPRLVWLARSAVLGAGAALRRAVDAAGGTERLKTAWRRRLRR
jgi:CelD/BcsL family acetyltransferase involved in cellulose biosynthesis